MKKCIFCNSPKNKILYRFPKFSVLQCKQCSFQYSNLHPTAKDLNKLYSKNYYHAWGLDQKSLRLVTRRMKMQTFKHYLDIIESLSGRSPKKLLDVGCATGFLLEIAKERDYDCYGVEISSYACQQATKLFGNHIFCGTLEDAKFPPGFFDVVAMADLLEHVIDPRKTLIKAKKILKENGLLFLVTPDVGSLSSKLMGKYWINYKEEHLYYFDKKSISRLLQELSFVVVDIRPAKKTLTLDYFMYQFRVYQRPIISQILEVVRFLPRQIRSFPFKIHSGDTIIIAKNES